MKQENNNKIKTKKISKGHYEFDYNNEQFEIVNNVGLIGFTWHCRHRDSLTATETTISKSYLIGELIDYLLDDFFGKKEYWTIQIDKNGLF